MVPNSSAPTGAGPISCGECKIGRHALYAPVHGRDPGRITAERHSLKVFAPHQTIIRAGELPKHVYSTFSGWAYRFKTLPDGRRHIHLFTIPGDFLGGPTLTGEPQETTVKALTQVVACAFDRKRIAEMILKSPELQASIQQRTVKMMRQFEGTTADLGRRSASARVASFMLLIERRLSERGLTRGSSFDFPIPQKYMADALGLTGVHVNRTMSDLRKSGLIAFQRNEVTILDKAALEEIAAA